MKLKSKIIGYSSVVGGGLMLTDERGYTMFLVNFLGFSSGISKEQSQELAEQINALINTHGLSAPVAFPPDNSVTDPSTMPLGDRE